MSEQSSINSEIDTVEFADRIALSIVGSPEFVNNRHQLGRTPEETRQLAEAVVTALQDLVEHQKSTD